MSGNTLESADQQAGQLANCQMFLDFAQDSVMVKSRQNWKTKLLFFIQ